MTANTDWIAERIAYLNSRVTEIEETIVELRHEIEYQEDSSASVRREIVHRQAELDKLQPKLLTEE